MKRAKTFRQKMDKLGLSIGRSWRIGYPTREDGYETYPWYLLSDSGFTSDVSGYDTRAELVEAVERMIERRERAEGF